MKQIDTRLRRLEARQREPDYLGNGVRRINREVVDLAADELEREYLAGGYFVITHTIIHPPFRGEVVGRA